MCRGTRQIFYFFEVILYQECFIFFCKKSVLSIYYKFPQILTIVSNSVVARVCFASGWFSDRFR
jgi:hypothetical protein